MFPERWKPDFLTNISDYLKKRKIKFNKVDLRLNEEIYKYDIRYVIIPKMKKYFKIYTQNFYSILLRSLTFNFFDKYFYSTLLAIPSFIYLMTRYADKQIDAELKKMIKNSKDNKKLEYLLKEMYKQSKTSLILGEYDSNTLARRNDIYTILKILEQSYKDFVNTGKKYIHSLILTGGKHSKIIKHTLKNYFGYEKIYSQKVPRHIIKGIDSSNLDDAQQKELLERRLI